MNNEKTCWMVLFLLMAGLCAQAAQSTELAFLNWVGYMDSQILTEFEQRTGITVKQSYFDSHAARDELLLETEGQGFDVAVINGASIRVLAKRGWLEPLAEADIPNLKHIDPRWRTAHERAEDYGVPYFWGTIGIAYRQDLVPYTVSSWMDLLRPPEALQGRVSMIGDSADMIGVALKALGYSLNSTSEDELNEAEALLQAQAPAVNTYEHLSLNKDSALVTGQAIMSMMYNGDAMMVQKHHNGITFVLPEEGSNIWVDYLSVLSASTEKVAAKQFIDFLNEPEIAARLAQHVYFATPNRAAEVLLSAEFKSDPTIYPGEKALEKSETYDRLPAQAQKSRAALFSRIVH